MITLEGDTVGRNSAGWIIGSADGTEDGHTEGDSVGSALVDGWRVSVAVGAEVGVDWK